MLNEYVFDVDDDDDDDDECRHSWVAGICYVDDADLRSLYYERQARHLPPIVCERCDINYHPDVHGPDW